MMRASDRPRQPPPPAPIFALEIGRAHASDQFPAMIVVG
jgi:hypothetical protein